MESPFSLILFPVVKPAEQLKVAPVEFRNIRPDPIMGGELVVGATIRLDEIKLKIKHCATDATTPAKLVSQPNPTGVGPMRFYRHLNF